MSGFIVRGRDITLNLGRGWGLSLDPYIYRCIASPALTTIHQELSTGGRVIHCKFKIPLKLKCTCAHA